MCLYIHVFIYTLICIYISIYICILPIRFNAHVSFSVLQGVPLCYSVLLIHCIVLALCLHVGLLVVMYMNCLASIRNR